MLSFYRQTKSLILICAPTKERFLVRAIIYNGNIAPGQTETFEWNSWMIRDFNSSIHIDNARNKHDLTNRKFEVECSTNTAGFTSFSTSLIYELKLLPDIVK